MREFGFGFPPSFEAAADWSAETGAKRHGWRIEHRRDRMSRRCDPVGAGQATACPQGGFIGVHFFGDFLCASKESYSPVSITLCAACNVKTGEKTHQPFKDGGIVSPVSRVQLRKKHV